MKYLQHVNPHHIHIVICLAYIIFGLAPIILYYKKGWVVCLKKVRLFYIIVGLLYATLVAAEHTHEQHVGNPAAGVTVADGH